MKLWTVLLPLVLSTAFAGTDRGNPYDFDAGAPKQSRWPDLFADTPNYRSFGKEVIGGRGEKFRWKMGPMWYRGRLTAGDVKVFIVGQEGAQDENVSNRSFTGSTGTRLQKFLNYLGIDRSYLFMNTFVYTITGQYSLFGDNRENESKLDQQKRLLWLAQNENSAVVKHRHELFNYMLETNKENLAVVIGVGTAGKDSVATWFQSKGEKCSSSTLGKSFCLGKNALKGVLAIGVRHPGAASPRNGGADARDGLRADFQNKANIVAEHIAAEKINLPIDPKMKRNFEEEFEYGHASIPHRDFAFGTNWSMGDWATTSNRRGAHAIQVFSTEGCYNNAQYRSDLETKNAGRCVRRNEKPNKKDLISLKYENLPDLFGKAPTEMEKNDVPYESPKGKNARRNYDAGPSKTLAKKLMATFTKIDWKELGVTQALSFGPAGMYRGNEKSAEFLIIADQASHTDMFSGRALTGKRGQKLQTLLKALNVADYFILRTLPVDTSDLDEDHRYQIAKNEKISALRNKVVDYVIGKGHIKAVLLLGETVKVLEQTMELNLPTYVLNDMEDTKSVKAMIKKLQAQYPKADAKKYDATLNIIPRSDLPMHTRWWMGTSGDRASRAYEFINGKKVFNGNYYQFEAPKWASKWKVSAKDMSSYERESLKLFNKWYANL